MNDQNIIPLFVAGSLLLALFAFFLVAYLIVQKRKQNTYQLEKQQMIFDHENNLLQTKLQEKENTMDQISMELHDNIKGNLGNAHSSIYRIAALATNNEQAVLIDETEKILGQVIADVHNISHSLNSNFIKNIGLVDTITKDLAHIKMSKNITYEIEVTGDKIPFGPAKELHIYRIAQEAIQNCIKHAKATNINFMISNEQHIFTMKITDNGIGFDKNKIYAMKGLGFINMFQRALYVNGTLEVESAPQEGSSITLTIN